MRLTLAIGLVLASSFSAITAEVQAQARPREAQKESAADKAKKSEVKVQPKSKDAQEQIAVADQARLSARLSEVKAQPMRFAGKIVEQSDLVELRPAWSSVDDDNFVVIFGRYDYEGNKYILDAGNNADNGLLARLQHPYLLRVFQSGVFSLTMQEINKEFAVDQFTLGNDSAQLRFNRAIRSIMLNGFPEKHIRTVEKNLSFPAYVTLKIGVDGDPVVTRVDVLLDANAKRLADGRFKGTFQSLTVTGNGTQIAVPKTDQWSSRLGPSRIQQLRQNARQIVAQRTAFAQAMSVTSFTQMTNQAMQLANQHKAEFWARGARMGPMP